MVEEEASNVPRRVPITGQHREYDRQREEEGRRRERENEAKKREDERIGRLDEEQETTFRFPILDTSAKVRRRGKNGKHSTVYST